MRNGGKNMDIESIINEMENNGNIQGYQYFDALKNRTILFNDECNESITERLGIPLVKFNEDSSNDPVHLIINSEGGSVFSSLYICNIIDNYKKPLYIHVLGYALSMGFNLAIAGYKNPNVHKVCYPFSVFMMHSGSLSLNGTSAQTKSFMKFNEKLEAKIKDYILTHTTIDEETYDKYSDDDFWLTAEDALNYGVVDAIIGGEDISVEKK